MERKSLGSSKGMRSRLQTRDWDTCLSVPLRLVFVPWQYHLQMSLFVLCGRWSVSVTCVLRKWPIYFVRHKGLAVWWRNTSAAPRSPFQFRFVNQSTKKGLMVCFIKLSTFFVSPMKKDIQTSRGNECKIIIIKKQAQ